MQRPGSGLGNLDKRIGGQDLERGAIQEFRLPVPHLQQLFEDREAVPPQLGGAFTVLK